jgi:hypothetical protein
MSTGATLPPEAQILGEPIVGVGKRRRRLGALLIEAHLRSALLSGTARFEPARSSSSPVWGFGASRAGATIKFLFLPYWTIVLGASAISLLPWTLWLRFRFSLRTLLIATTLVAIVLGLIVAVM